MQTLKISFAIYTSRGSARGIHRLATLQKIAHLQLLWMSDVVPQLVAANGLVKFSLWLCWAASQASLEPTTQMPPALASDCKERANFRKSSGVVERISSLT